MLTKSSCLVRPQTAVVVDGVEVGGPDGGLRSGRSLSRIVPAAGLEPNLLIPRSDPQIPLPTMKINPVIRIFLVSSLH